MPEASNDVVELEEGVFARPDELLVAADDVGRARSLLTAEGVNLRPLPPAIESGWARIGLESTPGDAVPATTALGRLARYRLTEPVEATYNYCYACPQMKGGPERLREPVAADVEPITRTKVGDGVTVLVVDTHLVKPRLAHDVHFAGVPEPSEVATLSHEHQGPAQGHATFVACCAARVAPGITVEGLCVLDRNGFADDYDITQALRTYRQATATLLPQLVNLSFCCWTLGEAGPVALLEELKCWDEKGSVIVAAAGNEGAKRETWPAAAGHVIGVSAVGYANKSSSTLFSNYGPWVDAGARGEDLEEPFLDLGEFTGGAMWSGTSFAAPRVAGRIAAMMTRDSLEAHAAWAALRRAALASRDVFLSGGSERPFVD